MKKEIRRISLDPSSFEVRADDDKEPEIEGYAALFDKETRIGDWFREVIAKGAFKRAISEKHDVRALINHDPNMLLARTKAGTLELFEDKKGLKVRFQPSDTSYSRDLITNMRAGNIDQMSFAFVVKRSTWTEEGGDLDLRTIEDLDLYDVSVVTYPQYEETLADLRSAESIAEERAEKIKQEREKEQEERKRSHALRRRQLEIADQEVL